MHWTKEIVESLIVELQKHRCLYAKTSPDYRNRSADISALQDLQEKLKEQYPNACSNLQPLEIKMKIIWLQNQHKKDHQKVIASLTSRTGNIYTPKLWCYNLLQFFSEDEVNLHVRFAEITLNNTLNFVLIFVILLILVSYKLISISILQGKR